MGSTAPKEMLPLVSRTIDIPSQTFLCKAAFGIDTEPNVDEINQYGGFDIEAERLAFIGGEWDSWRWASTQAPNARQRPDTLDKPVFVIPDAVHHCKFLLLLLLLVQFCFCLHKLDQLLHLLGDDD